MKPPTTYATIINWTPAMDALLGMMSDPQVADKLRLSKTPVRRRRVFLGIKPVKVQKHQWTEANLARLGKEYDKDIAVDVGISPRAVGDMRSKLGIEPFKRK